MTRFEYEFRVLTKNKEIRYVEVYGARTIYQGRPAQEGRSLDVTIGSRPRRRCGGPNRVWRIFEMPSPMFFSPRRIKKCMEKYWMSF